MWAESLRSCAEEVCVDRGRPPPWSLGPSAGPGGGPQGPQEPQWDTAAATLGSGGEGGGEYWVNMGGDTYRYSTNLATYSTELQYLILNKAHKYKTTL